MPSPRSDVQKALRDLQELVRRPTTGTPEPSALTFRLVADLATADATVLSLGHAEVAAMNAAAVTLTADLRFEHLNKPQDELQTFVARAKADQGKNHVDEFLKQHERQILDLVCYLTVEYLSVVEETRLLQLRLLPLTDASIPRAAHGLSLDKPVGCVAAVAVRGTSYAKMADRARTTAEHALRVMRVGLREHNSVHDRQLRFRLGTAYAFNDRLAGWTSRADVAYELKFGPHFADLVGQTPIWTLPTEPATDIDKKADLALRWLERARFTGEPLIALLYLFFALEALLGDKSEKLKADGLAFRQMMLSHIVTAEFTHPDTTWFLYDSVRSGAVHGENVPDVDDATLSNFESTVRDTLNQYLTLARSDGYTRRRQLLQALRDHPDRSKLIEWLRNNGGRDWGRYLDPMNS